MSFSFEIVPDYLCRLHDAFLLTWCNWNSVIDLDRRKQVDRSLEAFPSELHQFQEQILLIPVLDLLISRQVFNRINLREDSVQNLPQESALLQTMLQEHEMSLRMNDVLFLPCQTSLIFRERQPHGHPPEIVLDIRVSREKSSHVLLLEQFG